MSYTINKIEKSYENISYDIGTVEVPSNLIKNIKMVNTTLPVNDFFDEEDAILELSIPLDTSYQAMITYRDIYYNSINKILSNFGEIITIDTITEALPFETEFDYSLIKTYIDDVLKDKISVLSMNDSDIDSFLSVDDNAAILTDIAIDTNYDITNNEYVDHNITQVVPIVIMGIIDDITAQDLYEQSNDKLSLDYVSELNNKYEDTVMTWAIVYCYHGNIMHKLTEEWKQTITFADKSSNTSLVPLDFIINSKYEESQIIGYKIPNDTVSLYNLPNTLATIGDITENEVINDIASSNIWSNNSQVNGHLLTTDCEYITQLSDYVLQAYGKTLYNEDDLSVDGFPTDYISFVDVLKDINMLVLIKMYSHLTSQQTRYLLCNATRTIPTTLGTSTSDIQLRTLYGEGDNKATISNPIDIQSNGDILNGNYDFDGSNIIVPDEWVKDINSTILYYSSSEESIQITKAVDNDVLTLLTSMATDEINNQLIIFKDGYIFKGTTKHIILNFIYTHNKETKTEKIILTNEYKSIPQSIINNITDKFIDTIVDNGDTLTFNYDTLLTTIGDYSSYYNDNTENIDSAILESEGVTDLIELLTHMTDNAIEFNNKISSSLNKAISSYYNNVTTDKESIYNKRKKAKFNYHTTIPANIIEAIAFKRTLNNIDEPMIYWDYNNASTTTLVSMEETGDIVYTESDVTIKKHYINMCYYEKSISPQFARKLDFYKYSGLIRPDTPIISATNIFLDFVWDEDKGHEVATINTKNIQRDLSLLRKSDWAKLTGSIGLSYQSVEKIKITPSSATKLCMNNIKTMQQRSKPTTLYPKNTSILAIDTTFVNKYKEYISSITSSIGNQIKKKEKSIINKTELSYICISPIPFTITQLNNDATGSVHDYEIYSLLNIISAHDKISDFNVDIFRFTGIQQIDSSNIYIDDDKHIEEYPKLYI